LSTFHRLLAVIIVILSFIIGGCGMSAPIQPTAMPIITPVSPVPSVTPSADLERGAISISNVDQVEALATLAGHNDGVTGLVFLPDTAHLASLSGDLVLTLWDIKSGQKVGTLTEPGERVYNVAFSPNGDLLAVGNSDNTIGVWAVESGQLIQTLGKSKSFVMKIVFSPDGLLMASGDLEGTITVWDVKSGQELYTLQAPNSPIGSLAFSPNGALLASGNSEGNTNVTLWDMESRQALRTLSGHSGNVYNLVFTPDGNQLISSSGDLTIKIWDIESGQEIRSLRGHRGYVYGLALSPDGNLLASASADGAIKLWDAKSGEELRTLDSHDEYIYFLACSPDGSLLASSVNRGKAIILWGIKASGTAYLGQPPPGLTPQVFAPGVISIPSAMDFAGTFSSDGTDYYFTRRFDGQENVIYETHLVNGAWTEPAPASFSFGYTAFEPHLTADNQTIYFGWAHSRTSDEKSTLDEGGIWAADRTAEGWSKPRYVGEGMFVSSDRSGQVYVTRFAGGSASLSKVTLTDGLFANWENIAAGVHPAIAPDGSYLVSDDGNGYLRVRFLLANGRWSAAKDLTKQGIPPTASIASISPDGKYLFYTENGDIYWVSTDVIKNLNAQ